MNGFRQLQTLTGMGFRDLPQRVWPSLVIVVGIACVVAVLLSLLSSATGLRRTFIGAGRPDRVIVLSAGALGEGGSNLSREHARAIMETPGILKDSDGIPIASPELLSGVPAIRKNTGAEGRLVIRAMGPKGAVLRPEFKLTSGRMFRPGTNEAIIGETAQAAFEELDIGESVRLPVGQWLIVGTFVTGGDILEQDLMVDTDTVLPALRRNNYASVIARMESPASFQAIKSTLENDPALKVIVQRHDEYYAQAIKPMADFLAGVAYLVGAVMAAGAFFGTLNIMYSAVSARIVEMSTLRAIGFGGLPIVLAIVGETLILACAGAALGAGLAWLAFSGNLTAVGNTNFHLAVTPDILLIALAWTCAIALVGAFFPALRAARMPVATGLRAT